MAKRINSEDRKNNYQVERIRPAMNREKLNELYESFKSDDDYVNFHLDNIDDTHRRYMITILNDERKSPVKTKVKDDSENRDKSYAFMDKEDALEFITEYIDEGKANSKSKAVMQNGFSKRSSDKYKDLVEKEEKEYKAVNDFTKPSFEEVMNNIYVNTYNGSTYHDKENELPDDLREDVGVVIPGVIETREEYFEFVKRLKDRGRNGLGRSIYDKYEDYVEAVDLIEQYKQALFDKYGGKEEFFYAKDMGGMFGAYEYYPTIKPRFKKTARNIKLDKGINLNELALVKDMGRRIREELDEEIEQIEVNHDYTFYENTPPKFKDLPEDLKIFYKTDKNNINGFTHIKNFTSIEKHANDLIRSKDPDKQIEGYRIIENLKYEEMLNDETYEPNYTSVVDYDDLSLSSVISQFDYDRLLKETNYDMSYVDTIADNIETEKAFRKFLEYQLAEANGLDKEVATEKAELDDLVKFASRYVFDENFRKFEDEKDKVNSVGESLYRNSASTAFGKEEDVRNMRSKHKNGESKLTAYVKEIASAARAAIDRASSDADNVNKTGSTISMNDATGYEGNNGFVSGFELKPNPKDLLTYMKNNEELAKKIYELSSDKEADGMFSERTNIDDFVSKAKDSSKPLVTQHMIDKSLQSNRKGGN